MLGDVSMSAVELEAFTSARPRLFAIAYRLLGSAGEAEDAVQDAFVRWQAADRERVREPVAWLTKVLTNLCLNRLTSARARREQYVGQWLPEPVLTPDDRLGPLETVEQRESMSLAFLVLLERLTPPERAAFVLREAFGYGHREIAGILDVTEAGSQQLYHRAKGHVERERSRFSATDAQARRILERFLAAASGGDLAALEEILVADAAAWADGGGQIGVARHPILGVAKVARYFANWFGNVNMERLRRLNLDHIKVYIVEANGRPAVVAYADDRLLAVMGFDLVDGRVGAVRTMANPEKLRFIGDQLDGRDRGEPLLAFSIAEL
ncbi:RNA polymerase, sigma-24 subunit, ECF subfamily [Stackebrandtia nassauensis DSM 44728]|uniref:RNA polymerase, sigma-24 subunit, ECF subfamily n=2 Tax=Stackebrandtia TaxID=283810 RepID=D3Q3S4_STANL|nr:RNA polymerase, sigma-24 subunit, ECF subfamily [Stackebrandtia nassauensis DSM 44728]